jgi:hypothetical protein
MSFQRLCAIAILMSILASCSTVGTAPPQITTTATPSAAIPEVSSTLPSSNTQAPSRTPRPPRATPTATPSATPTLTPNFWMEMPVIPVVSERVREIYQAGIELGNDPKAFSRVGDCQSTTPFFLANFDGSAYDLGPYTELQEMIDNFAGSFSREGYSVRDGMTTASALSPLWSDPKKCFPSESPVECEYRKHNPTFSLITLGTNDYSSTEVFEERMRKILDITIERGIVPILGTKADDREGNNDFNRVLAKLAVEYQIPLWNFWLAIQPLPNHGMQEDGFHLTWGPPYFDDPENLLKAWSIRNLTALQALYTVWKAAVPAEAQPTLQATSPGN